MWGYLSLPYLHQGRSHFVVALVLVRAAYQMWWDRSCLGREGGCSGWQFGWDLSLGDHWGMRHMVLA